MKTKGNKAALVEQVEDAVMLATVVQGMINEDESNELREFDGAGENDDIGNDACDDEDEDSETDVD